MQVTGSSNIAGTYPVYHYYHFFNRAVRCGTYRYIHLYGMPGTKYDVGIGDTDTFKLWIQSVNSTRTVQRKWQLFWSFVAIDGVFIPVIFF